MKTYWVLMLLAGASSGPSLAFAQGQCAGVFTSKTRAPLPEDPLLKADLLELQRQETAGKTRFQVHDENMKTIQDLLASKKDPIPSERPQALPLSMLQKVYDSIRRNPVIEAQKNGKYDQSTTQIGYCFGRATYVHLALLKMGVDKGSIKKAWVVGHMPSSHTSWAFHVATIVRGADSNWYVIDSEVSRVMTLQAWTQRWAQDNPDGMLKLYVTDPQKFSAPLGTYDRAQLGLDLKKDVDWYKGFFQDLMAWFRTGELASVGLSRVTTPKSTPEVNPSAATSPPMTSGPAGADPTSVLSSVEILDRTLQSWNHEYRNAAYGSTAETTARQSLQSTAAQIESMSNSISRIALPWEKIEAQALHYYGQYRLSAAGSLTERSYQSLTRSFLSAMRPAFEAQVANEGWTTPQLLKAMEDFRRRFSQAASGSTFESTYREMATISSDLALKSYARELATKSFPLLLKEARHYDHLLIQSGHGSLSERTYDQMRRSALNKALDLYDKDSTPKTFKQLELEAIQFDESRRTSSPGGVFEKTFDQMRKTAMSRAIEASRPEMLNKTYAQLEQEALSFEAKFRDAPLGGFFKESYDRLRRSFFDASLEQFKAKAQEMSAAQKAYHMQRYQYLLSTAPSGSPSESYYRAVKQLLQ